MGRVDGRAKGEAKRQSASLVRIIRDRKRSAKGFGEVDGGATNTDRDRLRSLATRATLGAASLASMVSLACLGACGDDDVTPPPAECELDCTDGNPCTLDFCVEGACAYEPAPDASSCDDGDACNGVSVCDGAGQCVAGTAVAVDDGDACTLDACDPATGEVTHEPVAACLAWSPLTSDGAPSARTRHTAVWTGAEMIVWGGEDASGVTNGGARYDPSEGVWKAMSTTGAPAPRHSHVAAWTGTHMLVWGGFGASDYVDSGGAYDPQTDTWASMTTVGAPSGRTHHRAVWSGDELIVWGGIGPSPLGDGASYDPDLDAWTSLPAAGAPSPRYAHSAVWVGDRMVVWGGQNLADWLLDGAIFEAGQWVGVTSTRGAPTARQDHTAVWTGQSMVVWGGFTGGPYEDTGGTFDPASGASGTWGSLAVEAAPVARTEHVAVWTGTKMFVFGGCGTDSCAVLFGDGGLWTPSPTGGAWSPVAEAAALSPRKSTTAVWTGDSVIVWGGTGAQGFLGDGAIAPVPE